MLDVEVLYGSRSLADPEEILAKLSCRRYPAGLEPVAAAVEAAASGTSKSAISRRFVAATEFFVISGSWLLLVGVSQEEAAVR